jgi:DNA repair photolyase
LDKRLSKTKALLPDVVALSGTCDPYQPAEAKYHKTREILKVLAKHKYPVFISTKSTFILQDRDILANIAKNSWCTVALTITTLDEEIAQFLEPNAPTPQKRLETLKELKKIPSLQVGINFIPIVPFLCDKFSHLETMIKEASKINIDFILFGGGMTMRNNQAKWFLKNLNKNFPNLLPEYEKLYDFKYEEGKEYKGRYLPKRSYLIKIQKEVLALCKSYNIKTRIKRFIPDDYRKLNYIIAEKLLNKAYELQMLGKAWSNLHWAGQNIQNLKESIIEVIRRNELDKIRNINREIVESINNILKEVR